MCAKSQVLWLSICLSLFCMPTNSAADQLPDYLRAEVAVHIKEDGVMTGEINRLRLSCFEGQCEIDTLVLNRCTKRNNWDVQFPFSFTIKSSDEGTTFSIQKNIVDVSAITQGPFGKSLSTYHFVLSQSSNRAKVLKFSGGFVKDSNVTKKLMKIEFIPLREEYKKVQLACPIELPGLFITDD